ncbi:MAG: hypothetical protein J5897_00780, partial [Candidatus Methanomethylophilus sp.]|nr:hypothetical protein [Methanomethylophilus sp.]
MEMNNDNIDPEKVKKTRKDKTYATYRVAEGGVSGCDLVIERILNGKVTHQMFLLPSQGIYRRKEMRTGEIYTLDSIGFKRFFDGLKTAGDVWECPESPVFTEFKR